MYKYPITAKMQTRSKTHSATGFGSLQTSNVVLVVDKIGILRLPSTDSSRSPSSFATLKTSDRSKQDENGLYEVNIDFDDASSAWRSNKKSIGGGCYKYICEAKTQTGNNCNRQVISGCAYCKTHSKLM